MLGVLLVTLWASARVVVAFSPEALYALVGASVATFAVTTWFTPHVLIPRRLERGAGVIAGALGGFLGGVSTIWGPPMMMYFVMLRLSKETFIRAVGFIWFLASLPLVIGYVENGLLNGTTAPLSAAACVPAFAGLALGQWCRRFIDEEAFRRVLLIALFVIGLNLIRRAVF
jgi:uncharacterized membrane protein YfcA